MDPYVKLTLKREKFATDAVENGGINPTFNRTFLFNLDNCMYDEMFNLAAYSKEMSGDDTIGVSGLKVVNIVNKAGKGPFAMELRDEDNFSKVNGRIKVIVEWKGTGAPEGAEGPLQTAGAVAGTAPTVQALEQAQPASPLPQQAYVPAAAPHSPQPQIVVMAAPQQPVYIQAPPQQMMYAQAPPQYQQQQYMQPQMQMQPQQQFFPQQQQQQQRPMSYHVEQTVVVGNQNTPGPKFDDRAQLRAIELVAQLCEVRVWATSAVHGLQCVWLYNGQRIDGGRNTAMQSTQDMQVFSLDIANGEYLAGVSGRSGDWMDQVTFVTSRGRRMQFGFSTGGSPWQMDLPPGSKVVGFKGAHFGNYLRSLGLVFQMPQ